MIQRKYVLTPRKEKYIREHYLTLTDAQMAKRMRVPRSVLTKWRLRMQLHKRGVASKKRDNKIIKGATIKRNVKRLSDDERREYFLKQLRGRPRYQLMRRGLDDAELSFYEEKYIEYFSSPDIETITVQEEDDLHEMTMLQISIMRLRKEEFDSRISGGGAVVDNSKQIKDATELIMKFKSSLDIERKQRLKRQEDSATNFTMLIKEINEDHTRQLVGEEATMLKFRAEEMLNALIEKGLAHGIPKAKLENNFTNGKLPDDYEPPEIDERIEHG